jgi:hypothetical protein
MPPGWGAAEFGVLGPYERRPVTAGRRSRPSIGCCWRRCAVSSPGPAQIPPAALKTFKTFTPADGRTGPAGSCQRAEARPVTADRHRNRGPAGGRPSRPGQTGYGQTGTTRTAIRYSTELHISRVLISNSQSFDRFAGREDPVGLSGGLGPAVLLSPAPLAAASAGAREHPGRDECGAAAHRCAAAPHSSPSWRAPGRGGSRTAVSPRVPASRTASPGASRDRIR